MIIEIDNNNIDIINNSFLDVDYIKNELKNNPYAKILILEDNKKIIGYLYYSDIYERAEINQIEIDSFHRNCGNGKKLMNYFINSINKDITLEVNEKNIPAIKLYENCNFKKVAIRKDYYDGVDGILMERKKDS